MFKIVHRFFKKHSSLSFVAVIAVLIVIEASFSFCSKKKCPPFMDGKFALWFPYKNGDSLYFLSNKNNRDTIKNLYVHTSEEYETGGGYHSSYNCHSEAVVSSDRSSAVNMQVHYGINEDQAGNYLGLAIKGFTITVGALGDSGLVNSYGNSEPKLRYFESYIFNAVTYNKLQVIEMDTTQNKFNGIYKIWLAKNKGVVGYETYPTLERWAKQ